jgi:hypothetical protein
MTADSGKQALANGRNIKSGWSGMCQKYVRDPCWRVGSLYGSAIDAWNGSTKKHSGDRTPPVGAPCYYRGGNYGHAVISTGNGKVMRSTDCTYTGDISEVEIGWVESHWGYTYLGWTGDLNGVDLPLGNEGDDDMPLSDSDLDKIAQRVWNFQVAVYDDDAKEGETQKAKVTLSQTHNRAGEARKFAQQAKNNTD